MCEHRAQRQSELIARLNVSRNNYVAHEATLSSTWVIGQRRGNIGTMNGEQPDEWFVTQPDLQTTIGIRLAQITSGHAFKTICTALGKPVDGKIATLHSALNVLDPII